MKEFGELFKGQLALLFLQSEAESFYSTWNMWNIAIKSFPWQDVEGTGNFPAIM